MSFLLLFSFGALSAQEFNLNINVNENSNSQDYSLKYKPHPMKKTYIKVVAPSGLTGRIFYKRKLVMEDEIPFSYKARGDPIFTRTF